MKNNIYDELNDMKIDYEEVPLNDFERENLNKTVKSLRIKNKKNKLNKKILAIAASLILVFGIKLLYLMPWVFQEKLINTA